MAPGGPIAAGSWVLLPAGDPGKKSKAKGKKKGARDPRFASFVGRVERIVAGDDGGKWVDIRWLYKPGDIVDGVLPAKLRKRYSAKGTPRELLLSDHIDRNPLESVAGVTEVVHDSALADSAAAREGRAGPLFYRYIFLTKASPAKVVEDADGHLARRMFDGADLEAEHGATPMEAEDEEVEIRKLAREGPPPPPLRPAAGQASRPKRSRPAARGDSKAAKRQKPAQVQPQAAAIAELRQAQALEAQRRDLREAELKEQNEVLLAKVDGLAAKVDGLAAKSAQQEKLSAQQERLIAHLERFNAQVLEENEELRRLLLAKEG